ncbi:sensor domain-containing protein [Brevibacillus panacihumi]|uniref:sensor domain-containing protein n=1 Tax=Brevibacillus panacihumi TaxID=497735 RepID=UPI003D2596A6
MSNKVPQRLQLEIYKTLFENNPDAGYAIDSEGYFFFTNESTLQLTGYTRAELHQMNFLPFIKEEDRDRVVQHFVSALNGNVEKFVTTITPKNGEDVDLYVTAVPIILNGSTKGIVGIAKNLSDLHATQNELIQSRNQLQHIFDSIDVCLWSMDMQTNSLLHISPACQKIYGYTQQEFAEDPSLWRRVIHPLDRKQVEARQPLLLEGKALKHDYRIVDKNGKCKWISDYTIPILDEFNQLVRLDGVCNDITQQKVYEEQLHFMAYHDTLTGLPNRRLLTDRLQQALTKAAANKTKVALLFLDLDRFTCINDSLGHNVGDELLQIVSNRLTSRQLEWGTISRQGGDEFAIVLEDFTRIETVLSAVEKALWMISSPIWLNGQEYVITTSVGISMYPDHGHDPDALLKRADQAMYFAKGRGGNQYQIYRPGMAKDLSRKVLIEQSLHKALGNNEFFLVYQPIIHAPTGIIVGFEALIRWHHPLLGMISPSEFIPLAEEAGLIHSIGIWILKTACLQSKSWQKEGLASTYVSINASARQFDNDDFVKTIEQILDETGLPPHCLRIEITESTAMTNVMEMISKLTELSRLGVNISIDDFGTGYSSLSYLKKFPINTLKVDQSFVRDISKDKNQEAIIQAIVALADSLGIHVVAEGVEAVEQYLFLQKMGCQDMQGYFFSKPVPPEQVEDLLRSGCSFLLDIV